MLADDHQLFANGLVSILKHFPLIEVVGTASNGKELLSMLKLGQPDVILLDLQMPVMDGFKAQGLIKRRYPKVKVVILSSYVEPVLNARLLIMGTHGYLKKDSTTEEVIKAIETVHAGDFFFEKEVSSIAILSLIKSAQKILEKLNLTLQEIDILRLICEEKTSEEIADNIGLTIKTVEYHRTKIYEKTGAQSLAGLIRFATKNGILFDE